MSGKRLSVLLLPLGMGIAWAHATPGPVPVSDGTVNFGNFSQSGDDSLTSTDFVVTATGSNPETLGLAINVGTSAAYVVGGTSSAAYIEVQADGVNTGSFQLTGLTAVETAGAQFTGVSIVGFAEGGIELPSMPLAGDSQTDNEVFTFGQMELVPFFQQQLSGFRLVFACDGACPVGDNPLSGFEFRSFTVAGGATPSDPPADPVVNDAAISLSGATGTAGTFRVGDTVTVTWDNTADGDNNGGITAVTVDFSAFGGDTAVLASNADDVWTATYTIEAGDIDDVDRNVSVTAYAGNADATMTDTTDAAVDNIPPEISGIQVSGTPAASAVSMTFAVSFGDAVSGISTGDFTLAATGNATGTLQSVSGASGTSVDVTVAGISGQGTLKLNLPADSDIVDDAGNPVVAYSAGATHTVQIAPVKSSQTLTFASVADQTLGSSLTVSATASSGLTPVFTSSTTSVCTVTSQGVVTLISIGTCTLLANQAGNDAFFAAQPVPRSFAVVAPPNSAPVITQGDSIHVDMSEDGQPQAFALTLAATDADAGDILTWRVVADASHGHASVTGGVVSYLPAANFNGIDSFVIEVSDGTDTDSIAVTVAVAAVNDAPTISGTPATALDQDTAYAFLPVAADIDGSDTRIFSITGKPSWASFNTATGLLTGVPSGADSGVHSNIVIAVSDGTDTVALPAFQIEVLAMIDPLQPIVTPPADVTLDATGLYTPVTERQLLGLAGEATQGALDAARAGLARDGVSGNECCVVHFGSDSLPRPQGSSSDYFMFPPGRHEIRWKATNAVGVTGEAIQIVKINPLVSLSTSQSAVRGSDIGLSVKLNGPAPDYPFRVPVVIDSGTTASPSEHNFANTEATFTEPGQVEVTLPISLSAVSGFADSQLVIALGEDVHTLASNRHVINIVSGNVPPVVNMSITQGGIERSLILPTDGPVTVTATVTDGNASDTHSFDWSPTSGLADTDSNPVNASLTFDPAGLTESHQVKVNVTDSAGAVVEATVHFRVVSELPALTDNTDTDQDGISDSLEGTGDTDDDGILDYIDNMPSSNILPQQGNTTNAYLIECDPGVRCGLGLFARSGSSGGVQVKDEELGILEDLIVDPAFEPVGGVFDFAIRDLPTPGQSVRVVMPQRAAIPANAVYRKYQRGQWITFVSDGDNAVHSAAGNPGYCPPPGADGWTPGLTAGHLCVRLTLEDGGPNDDDGLINSAVVDPGAVSVERDIPPEPEVRRSKGGGGGAFSWVWLVLVAGAGLLRRSGR